jgi:Capsular polysaccharide synthesis protein
MPGIIEQSHKAHVGPFDPGEAHVPRPNVDIRTDAEILAALSQPPPVTSQKNVWAWWDSGLANMRPWCQRNVIGWVRVLGSSWTVRVLDSVKASPSNWQNFLDPLHVPECFKDGTLHGDHARTLGSDMARLPCLVEHGGVYLDVGIMLFVDLDQLCWNTIQDRASSHEVALPLVDPTQASGAVGNFFIAARKANGLLRRWMEIFQEAWKGRKECRGMSEQPLFSHLVAEGNLSQNFKESPPHALDYFSHLLSWDRLRLLQDPTDGFSGPNYCRNHVMLLGYQECAAAAMLTEDEGTKQFQLLSVRYDQSIDTCEFREAKRFCNHMLSKAAMMKLYHFRDHDMPTLAELWDRPENNGADCKPGTFAEYLRQNSVHFAQTRKIVPVKFPPVLEQVLHAGLLDVDDE